jgi:Ca2+/H+ antiporter, TMEM165/GDT1 family
MTAYIASLLFVVLAEMGDKTQLVAMAFATRYRPQTVLLAVFFATLLNHALAVVAGRFLSTIVPLDAISLVAACSFILFGLWTLRGDTLDGEDRRHSSFGPLLTVGIAFFLAELGDKTQLATISLAVEYSDALGVLLGTTTGMVIADSIGIVIGIILGKRIPETLIRWVSSGVFIFFGFFGVSRVLSAHLALAYGSGLLFLLSVLTLGAIHYLVLRGTPRADSRAALAEARPIPLRVWPSLRREGRPVRQVFQLGMLAVGWLAGLGLFDRLAGVDHWITFILLSVVGWKTIHQAVRVDAIALGADSLTISAVLTLSLATSIQALLVGLRASLAVVPIAILVIAVGVLAIPSSLAATSASGRVRRICQSRIEIASGLVLIGIAAKTLIEHLA